MKIYTLTIGINEEDEVVEFIKEEQYETDPVPIPVTESIGEEDNFESLLKRLKLSIVGHA